MKDDLSQICLAISALFMVVSVMVSVLAYDKALIAEIRAKEASAKYDKIVKKFYCE